MERLLKMMAPNGEPLEVPAFVWVAAIMAIMTDTQRGELFEKVRQIRDTSIAVQFGAEAGSAPYIVGSGRKSNGEKPNEITVDEKGRWHHRMHAETGNYKGTLRNIFGGHGLSKNKKPH